MTLGGDDDDDGDGDDADMVNSANGRCDNDCCDSRRERELDCSLILQ